MFELRTSVEFPAAHHLVGYPGDCARPHGHNWRIEAFVEAPVLDDIGMALDFRAVKQALKEVVAAWDHQDLNTLEDFKDVNPSAERIAQVCFTKLQAQVDRAPIVLTKVTVWENDRCAASFYPDPS